MMLLEKTNIEKVKYSKQLKGSYWGRGKRINYNKEIYDNRDKFVEEFNIKKYIQGNRTLPFKMKLMHYYMRVGDFDHSEMYATEQGDQIIIIVSPYMKIEINKPKEWQYMFKLGWRPYKCLYEEAYTYILKLNISTLRELKLKRKYRVCICETCKTRRKIIEEQEKEEEEEDKDDDDICSRCGKHDLSCRCGVGSPWY